MKVLIGVVSFFILCWFIGYADSVKVVHKKDGFLVTNISKHLFFARAFEYSSSKDRVLKLIKEISKKYGVDYHLVEAIAEIESDYKIKAVSKKGAKGVMQLMDKTAKYYGVSNPYDIRENIKGGIKFIKHLIEKYHNARLVAAAYNAGETAVDKYGGIPPYSETEKYVEKFLSVYHGKMRVYVSNQRYISGSKERIINSNGVYTNIRKSLW